MDEINGRRVAAIGVGPAAAQVAAGVTTRLSLKARTRWTIEAAPADSDSHRARIAAVCGADTGSHKFAYEQAGKNAAGGFAGAGPCHVQ